MALPCYRERGELVDGSNLWHPKYKLGAESTKKGSKINKITFRKKTLTSCSGNQDRCSLCGNRSHRNGGLNRLILMWQVAKKRQYYVNNQSYKIGENTSTYITIWNRMRYFVNNIIFLRSPKANGRTSTVAFNLDPTNLTCGIRYWVSHKCISQKWNSISFASILNFLSKYIARYYLPTGKTWRCYKVQAQQWMNPLSG